MNAALWIGTLGASILIVTVFLTAYLDQQHRKRIIDLERQVRQLDTERATWKRWLTECEERIPATNTEVLERYSTGLSDAVVNDEVGVFDETEWSEE